MRLFAVRQEFAETFAQNTGLPAAATIEKQLR